MYIPAIILAVVSIIISIIILVIGISKLSKANKISFEKNYEQEKYNNDLKAEGVKLLNELNQHEQEIERKNIEYNKVNADIAQANINLKEVLKDVSNTRKLGEEEVEYQLNKSKERMREASSCYAQNLESAYLEAEKEYDEKINQCKEALNETQSQLETLKSSLAAGVEAQLRDREREEKQDFFKVKLSTFDEEDVARLERLKPSLYNKDILSKLIWTTYFQKQTTEMCNRILGAGKVVCGIYKITNLLTKQMYVGQSVDIATRWKSHMRCGLGLDAPATNRLYKAMQEDGVWNFTFELLEECPRQMLDEKEAFWINMYQADKFGYNSTRGNNLTKK